MNTPIERLLAALREPASEGLSPESHPYVLSARDATDLSAFLVRRFPPPGGPDQSVMADTLDAGARVLLAQARGEISDSPYILFARQIRVTHQK